MANWDVIVIGLGGVGSSAAFHLADAGHRVLGLDQYPAVHSQGSSHGKTRIIRQAYFEHPSYVPLLRRAYELWDQAEQRSGRRLFHRTGIVEVGPPEGVVIPGILRSAREFNLPIEQLDAIELSRRWPGVAGQSGWQGVVEKNAGYLEVEECVRTHLRMAQSAGAKLSHQVTVRQWQDDGQGVKVVTDDGVHHASHLVVAGGPWSESLIGELSGKLQVLRKHLYWFRPSVAGFREDEGFPCFFHETPQGMFYGFPDADGSGVKVARHSGGQPIDQPVQIDATDEMDRQLIEAFVAEYLPGVGNELLDQAGCYYTSTPDEHFVVDCLPDRPQVTVVAGLSGHGFKFTSVLGELASQLASGQTPSLDIDLFKIDRLTA